MKKAMIVALIIIHCILMAAPIVAGELDKPYNPSRKEWLEVSIFKIIKDRTDVWKQRIGLTVWVKEEEGTIFITISSANGEEPMKNEAIQEYIKYIKSDVSEFIKKYEWSSKLKVYVQYI